MDYIYTAISWILLRWHDFWDWVLPDGRVLGTNCSAAPRGDGPKSTVPRASQAHARSESYARAPRQSRDVQMSAFASAALMYGAVVRDSTNRCRS